MLLLTSLNDQDTESHFALRRLRSITEFKVRQCGRELLTIRGGIGFFRYLTFG